MGAIAATDTICSKAPKRLEITNNGTATVSYSGAVTANAVIAPVVGTSPTVAVGQTVTITVAIPMALQLVTANVTAAAVKVSWVY